MSEPPLRDPIDSMHIKNSPVKFRGALRGVRWRAHDASVAVEEELVWRSADAVRDLAERAGETPVGRSAGRLRWLLDRRLFWPLTDRLQEQGDLARTAIGTVGVALAVAAAWGGAMVASAGEEGPAAEAGFAVVSGEAAGDTLEGVAPSFTSGKGGAGSAPVKQGSRPSGPIGRTAWDFAQAFVLYEVGRADDAAEDFERLATPALAKSLSDSPPRLPAQVKVPEAQVLNVVVGEPLEPDPATAPGADKKAGDELTVDASVSMVRLQAVSELRLTLKFEGDGWLVEEIRG